MVKRSIAAALFVCAILIAIGLAGLFLASMGIDVHWTR
jgi:hypothetical protein